MLSKLRGLTSSAQTSESDYASMLRCMCDWNQCDDVMELITDWLKPALNLEQSVSLTGSSSSKRVIT